MAAVGIYFIALYGGPSHTAEKLMFCIRHDFIGCGKTQESPEAMAAFSPGCNPG
jgi:hypothetical protein